MGNSRYPKDNGSPKRIYPDLNQLDNDISDYDLGTSLNELTFYLVKINYPVAIKSYVNESVYLIFVDNGIEVQTNNGKLGSVPLIKVNIIKNSHLKKGYISNIENDNEKIQISLTE